MACRSEKVYIRTLHRCIPVKSRTYDTSAADRQGESETHRRTCDVIVGTQNNKARERCAATVNVDVLNVVCVASHKPLHAVHEHDVGP